MGELVTKFVRATGASEITAAVICVPPRPSDSEGNPAGSWCAASLPRRRKTVSYSVTFCSSSFIRASAALFSFWSRSFCSSSSLFCRSRASKVSFFFCLHRALAAALAFFWSSWSGLGTGLKAVVSLRERGAEGVQGEGAVVRSFGLRERGGVE